MSIAPSSGKAPAKNSCKFISVIIPHYRQLFELRLCLNALFAQTYPKARFELIVANNDPSTDLDALRSEFPSVKFIHVARKGAAHARNAGLAIAQGQIIAFTDADCVADPNWLQSGVRGLTGVDYVGGAIDVGVEDSNTLTPVEAFERVFAFRQRDYIERKNFAATANLFVTAVAARAIGPFRQGVGEDIDWGHRAHALGFRLAFNDMAIITHPARRDWSALTHKWARLVTEQWCGRGQQTVRGKVGWLALAVTTAMSSGPHLIRVATSRRISGVRSRLGAARVLIAIRIWRAWRMVKLMAAERALSSERVVEAS